MKTPDFASHEQTEDVPATIYAALLDDLASLTPPDMAGELSPALPGKCVRYRDTGGFSYKLYGKDDCLLIKRGLETIVTKRGEDGQHIAVGASEVIDPESMGYFFRNGVILAKTALSANPRNLTPAEISDRVFGRDGRPNPELSGYLTRSSAGRDETLLAIAEELQSDINAFKPGFFRRLLARF